MLSSNLGVEVLLQFVYSSKNFIYIIFNVKQLCFLFINMLHLYLNFKRPIKNEKNIYMKILDESINFVFSYFFFIYN